VFGLGAATRIYLAPGATDMRNGFNGLYGLMRDQLLCDPFDHGCDLAIPSYSRETIPSAMPSLRGSGSRTHAQSWRLCS
jgi:hypothetical protein